MVRAVRQRSRKRREDRSFWLDVSVAGLLGIGSVSLEDEVGAAG
jgi:hypothetical protein